MISTEVLERITDLSNSLAESIEQIRVDDRKERLEIWGGWEKILHAHSGMLADSLIESRDTLTPVEDRLLWYLHGSNKAIMYLLSEMIEREKA